MSENAKVVAALLLLLLALGVVGDMDYNDARRSEQTLPNADLWLQRNAAAMPSYREPLTTDDAANNDCLNVQGPKTNDAPAECDISRPVR
jgi:hypothetical protein